MRGIGFAALTFYETYRLGMQAGGPFNQAPQVLHSSAYSSSERSLARME